MPQSYSEGTPRERRRRTRAGRLRQVATSSGSHELARRIVALTRLVEDPSSGGSGG